jgi:hypothetical protein
MKNSSTFKSGRAPASLASRRNYNQSAGGKPGAHRHERRLWRTQLRRVGLVAPFADDE